MKKGGFMKDALILFAITLIAGALLGAVYEITKGPILMASQKDKVSAYQAVLSEAVTFESEDITGVLEQANDQLAGLGFGNVSVDDCATGKDAGGNIIGYVVTATSKDGYGGAITASVGISPDGRIQGIEFLTLNETVGFGMAAKDDPEWKKQYYNKDTRQFTVTKSGAAEESEVNAISGATITSNAITGAVNAAVYFVGSCLEQ